MIRLSDQQQVKISPSIIISPVPAEPALHSVEHQPDFGVVRLFSGSAPSLACAGYQATAIETNPTWISSKGVRKEDGQREGKEVTCLIYLFLPLTTHNRN